MWMRRLIGGLLVVVGTVWFAQGINLLGGSAMTGNAFWAIVGAPMVVVGVLLISSARASRRAN